MANSHCRPRKLNASLRATYMTQPFYRKEDINMRLVNGVVMARGEPVMLTGYDGTHLHGETLYGIPMHRGIVMSTPHVCRNVSINNR